MWPTSMSGDATDESPRTDEPAHGTPEEDDDREVRLHSELSHEAKRVVTHPVGEAHRLSEELTKGEADTTPVIALTGLAIWLAVIVAIVVALVILAIYLV
jgi:hypothetical protein